MMASALMSFMAACNNDAIEDASSQVEQAGEEIVGAKLLSNGATMSVASDGSANSRMVIGEDGNAHFTDGDEIGLGWFNIGSSITKDQPTSFDVANTIALELYANHLFCKSGVCWDSKANVYQGAHLAYFPHEHMSKVGVKVFKLENKQTSADLVEVEAKRLMMSPKFILSEDDVKDTKLQVSTDLYAMTNALKFNVNSSNSPFGTNPVLSKETIDEVRVTVKRTGSNQTFVNQVILNPHKLPETMYNQDGTLNAEKNKEKMRDAENLFLNSNNQAFAVIPDTKLNTKISTTVAYDATLNSNPVIYTSLFPSAAVTDLTTIRGEIPVRIDIETRFGHFTFANATNDGVKKVTDFLKGDIADKEGKKHGINTLSHVFNVKLDLDKMSWFSPSYQINNVQDWKDAVAFANALNEEFPNKYTEATFTLKGDVVFDNEPIFAQENNVLIKVVSPNDMGNIIIDGSVDMVKNLEFPVYQNSNNSTNNQVEIKVNETGTFNVVEDVASSIVNHGTVVISKGKTASKVYNQHGRIELVYGAFAETDQNGTVAYTLTEDTKPYMIANLLKPTKKNPAAGSQQRFAEVNTLVVPAGLTLDLSQEDTQTETDPYYDQAPATKMPDLSKVNVELQGGNIKHGKSANGSVEDVNNVTVFAAGSTMTDVKVLGTLTVAGKGNVTVDATPYMVNDAMVKALQSIKNATLETNGTVVFNVNAAILAKLNTKAKSLLTINQGYTVTYRSTDGLNGIKDGYLVQK